MIKLLNLEIKINQYMTEIEQNCMEILDYMNNFYTNIEKEDAINLLLEIPDILLHLKEILTIYVTSVEEEYAKLGK